MRHKRHYCRPSVAQHEGGIRGEIDGKNKLKCRRRDGKLWRWRMESGGFFLKVRKGPDPTIAQHHAATILLQSNKTPEKKRKPKDLLWGSSKNSVKANHLLVPNSVENSFICLLRIQCLSTCVVWALAQTWPTIDNTVEKPCCREDVLTLFLSFLALSIWLSITRK